MPLGLLLAAPVPVGPIDPVGVAWHDEATVEPALRQRVIDAVANAAQITPDRVFEGVVERARQRIALEISPAAIAAYEKTRRDLDAAAMAYRRGDLDAARERLRSVVDQIRQNAVAPGTARLAWRAHVLAGQVAWTQGDNPAADDALRRAVVIDPSATLSTRRVPPAFAKMYRRIQARIVATQSSWPTPAITSVQPAQIEIDGRIGLRPVPPGLHFVVVRREGMPPTASQIEASAGWSVPPGAARLDPGLPVEAVAAEDVCESLGLRHLVLARRRGSRVALQGYACGQGFGPTWYGGAVAMGPGGKVATAVGVTGSGWGPRSELDEDDPWPRPRIRPRVGPVDRPVKPPPKKPWYKRAWVWTVIIGAAAAIVVTGAVVGTRPGEGGVEVPADDFLNPDSIGQ